MLRLLLLLGVAQAAVCPSQTDGNEAEREFVSLELPAGCTAPYTGRLYNAPMILSLREDFEKARIYVEEAERQRDTARGLLASCRSRAADELDACAEPVPVLPPPPGRAWVWAGAGALAVGAPLGACELVDCGPGHARWVAAGTSAVVIVGLAWLLD